MTKAGKRSEDLAKELFIQLGNCPELHQDNCSCFGKIAKALESYADERLEEAWKFARYAWVGKPQADAFYYRGRKDEARRLAKLIKTLKSGRGG